MKPKGTLIAIGGNEAKEIEIIDERFHADFGEGMILKNIINQAGGEKSRIEVITTASDIPTVVGEKYKETFEILGTENVGILDIRDPHNAENSKVLKRIEDTDVVMFSGGDQSQISHYIRNTKVHELIMDRYMNDDEFIVAGTSAGAVVMSQNMIAGGRHKHTLTKNDLRMSLGLGLIKEVIFDSHFIRRRRFGRLAEAVAKYPDKLGIGLGEDTGMMITEGNICEIIGSGMVILFDGSNFTHNSYDSLKNHIPISLANLTVHILAPKDKYFIREKKAEIHYNPQNHEKEISELP